MRKLLQEAERFDIEVASAGIYPAYNLPMPAEARAVLREEGVAEEARLPRGLTKIAADQADLILVMEEAHLQAIVNRFPETASKVHVLRSFARLSGDDVGIKDPYGRSAEIYKATLASIKEALTQILKNLKDAKGV